MTVYNSGKAWKVVLVFSMVLLIIGTPSFAIFMIARNPADSLLARFALVGSLIYVPIIILYCKPAFCTFIISEKGITRKLLGRSLFSAWEEFQYIGVGEELGSGLYRFALYFSKTPPKRIYLGDNKLITQNSEFYFVRYREGLLEEVLKYVDEKRIEDIERIRECPDPHTAQPLETSKRRQQKRGYWD